MADQKKKGKGLSSFTGQFWLVVVFEFFERGSYYGMMSILSVYLTDILNFSKESVGIIKGTIQPLLYFLPIISGALADRFGYRRTLMVAFSLLGLGYFLTSQATDYALVFGALVVMGFGAGTFKPIISGTIARVTDEENSTLGFGIFYWSINLGAFLFPLILVPFLKKMDWTYVIIASAICTGVMLIPTFFFYKDPVKQQSNDKSKQTNLIQTLANAFEIIYSPVVLLYNVMKQTAMKRLLILGLLLFGVAYSLYNYLQPPGATEVYSRIGIVRGESRMAFQVDRNMLGKDYYSFNVEDDQFQVTIFKPQRLEEFADTLLQKIRQYAGFESITLADLEQYIQLSDKKIQLSMRAGHSGPDKFELVTEGDNHLIIVANDPGNFENYQTEVLQALRQYPLFSAVQLADISKLYAESQGRPFFILYVLLLVLVALGIISYSNRKGEVTTTPAPSGSNTVPFFLVTALGLIFWFLPGLTMLGRIVSFIIYFTATSLFIIDKSDKAKFIDHAKFLLMIFLYSGFWILYFQMFDSVLWYVQAYVDGTNLNTSINNFLGIFGINLNWTFDIEHVTVINAGTIILLQLFISNIVKTRKALPTMITGIAIGTLGMAILAISANIWVFVIGIILFSIGEMTAHPKFISYIGIIAPSDKKAMYMGYLFLYGVFGSSIGGIVGAKLYVHFVDGLNQPKLLWLIFAGIGVVTIVALLLYNRFLAEKTAEKK
ncbi:MAG: hypothetical protein Kow0042_05090 [Calditrichia bacterium]